MGEFDSYLAEYKYQRLHPHFEKKDVFSQFLKDFSKIYPLAEKDLKKFKNPKKQNKKKFKKGSGLGGRALSPSPIKKHWLMYTLGPLFRQGAITRLNVTILLNYFLL